MVLDEASWKGKRWELSEEAWTQDFVGDAVIGDNMAEGKFSQPQHSWYMGAVVWVDWSRHMASTHHQWQPKMSSDIVKCPPEGPKSLPVEKHRHMVTHFVFTWTQYIRRYYKSDVIEIRIRKALVLCCQTNLGKIVISLDPVISSVDWDNNDTHPIGLM